MLMMSIAVPGSFTPGEMGSVGNLAKYYKTISRVIIKDALFPNHECFVDMCVVKIIVITIFCIQIS